LLEASAGDAKAAAEHLGKAKEYAKTAKDDGASLPPLPPELVTAPAKSSPSSVSASPQNGSKFTVPGSFKALQGDASKDKLYSISLLELKPDGVMNFTLTMPDISKPGELIVNKSIGTWALNGPTLSITFKSMNGTAIPADDPKKVLVLTFSGDGKHLTSPDSLEFARQ
jgi:hypothetical protein